MKITSIIVYRSFMFLAVLLTTVWMSCEAWLNDDDLDPAPADCNEIRPTEGHLSVRYTLNADNPMVSIEIYRGDFENHDLILKDTLPSTNNPYLLPIDEYYSVVAKYYRGQDTIIVIDGDDIEADETEYSDKSCWSVDNGNIDVKLKF
jgi:hypothetical protein